MRKYALLALLLLSGCSWFSSHDVDFTCPKTGFIADADKITLPGADAVFKGYTGGCSPDGANAVKIDLTLPFAAKKTNPAAPATVTLPYFIAVLSPDEEILQRQAFTTTITFDKATGEGESSEEHSVKLPLPAGAQAYKYKVVMGFALTPAQLKFNKENK